MKRNTIQKKLILDSVENLKNHPTADEIYEDIAKTHPTISKGTVYRNLNTMCDDNAVFRVKVHNGSDRFDFNIKPHYHFECQECKKVFDIDFEYMEDILKQISNNEGFIISGYDLMFWGTCNNCKIKNN